MSCIYLGDRPEFFPIVARWIWDEWRHLLTQRSLTEFEAWFRADGRGRGLPTTLVWIENESPIATVSLECDDMDIRPDLSPWLASLYVLPAQQGRGIGRALVRAAEDEARALGISVLHLFTPAHEEFYRALGWECLERCDYCAIAVSVMQRRLRP